jgi:hypothetical protein
MDRFRRDVRDLEERIVRAVGSDAEIRLLTVGAAPAGSKEGGPR